MRKKLELWLRLVYYKIFPSKRPHYTLVIHDSESRQKTKL